MPLRLPFEINRHSGEALVDQVVGGVASAIRMGRLKAGDRLPSREGLARELGVSVRVARDAIARLAADSLVSVRPRIGCEVLASKQTFWRRRVVAVMPAMHRVTYYVSVMVSELQRRMSAAGCLFDCVPLNAKRGRTLDLRPLEEQLRHQVDMAFAFFVGRPVCDMLARRGIPTALLPSDGSCTGCAVRVVDRARSDAFARLAQHCREVGVRHALVAGYGIYRDLVGSLRDAGVSVETYSVPDKFGRDYLEDIQREAMNTFLTRFSPSGRRARPELVISTDDFVSRGILAAFSALGIRCPEDVMFVSAVNKGFGPVYQRSLARIETDPWRDAEAVADAALTVMEGGSADDVAFDTRYVRGETFP